LIFFKHVKYAKYNMFFLIKIIYKSYNKKYVFAFITSFYNIYI